MPNDRATGRPRGFAFVEFEDQAAVAEAIEKFNGHELDGRPLRVNEAEARPSRPPRFSGPPQSFDGGYDGGFGGGYGGGRDGGGKPKGSRRNLRRKKRSL